MSEKYDNSGAMFVNDRKESKNHPDRNGSCVIEGREYWISGWIKEGKKGQFLSLSFKPKEAAKQKKDGGAKFQEDSDSIPF